MLKQKCETDSKDMVSVSIFWFYKLFIAWLPNVKEYLLSIPCSDGRPLLLDMSSFVVFTILLGLTCFDYCYGFYIYRFCPLVSVATIAIVTNGY